MSTLNFTKRLQAVSVVLGRIPSLAFGAAYLLLIPSFAVVYTWMGRDFFHSTVQYELDREAASILLDLRSAIQQSFELTHKDSRVFDGWKINLNEMFVRTLKVNGDSLSFELIMDFESVDSRAIHVRVGSRIVVETETSLQLDRDFRIARIVDPIPTIHGYAAPPPFRELLSGHSL